MTNEPYWYAVVSERAPIINKAIRSLEVAEEYAGKCRDSYCLVPSAVEVIPLYALKWRSIDEAPRDGTPFLAWNGHWRGVAAYHAPNYEGDPVWVDEQREYITPPPTHCMPLPPAPAT